MTVKCPACRRQVGTYPELNGVNQPTGRLRYQQHTGSRWGRMCEKGGDLIEQQSPTPTKGGDHG